MNFFSGGVSNATERFGSYAQREHLLNHRFEPCGPPGTYNGMLLSNHGTKGPLILYGRLLRGTPMLGGVVSIGFSLHSFYSEGVNPRTVGSFLGGCGALYAAGTVLAILNPWISIPLAAVIGYYGSKGGGWLGEKLGGVDLASDLSGLENFEIGRIDDIIISNGYIILVNKHDVNKSTATTIDSYIGLDDFLWLIY